MTFEKLLIANRGEIACRIIRTAHHMGYTTVAVYSDADASALHTRMADEAVRIGPPPAIDSYLNIDALLEAARRTGADAIHPGYGFLSERPDFVDACTAAGLIFVGPPARAMRAMGDKAEAKRRMLAAGVPCVPGFIGDAEHNATDEQLRTAADALGLPLLVKAVAGGGGRGQRIVRTATEFPEALASARREARSAFGDGRLMLERLVEHARHVEVQVFCDAHGNAVHLGERDCTAQRRRQKVVEESPSPHISEAQRARLCADALAAARAAGYVGAGTVEFIIDEAGQHFFLEMNTRLQVEHPVTEARTGLDLVEWQLRVARGEPLPLAQHEITFTGHAIEARLCAEDPADEWRPQVGRVRAWSPEDAGVRVDHGIAVGDTISPYYDAMVAKFIAHGTSRDDAIRRLRRALADAPLVGVATNAGFVRRLLDDAEFRTARLTTTRLDEWTAARAPVLAGPAADDDVWALAAALLAGGFEQRPASLGGHALALEGPGANGQRDTRRVTCPPPHLQVVSSVGSAVRWRVRGVERTARAWRDGRVLHLLVDGTLHRFETPSPHPRASATADASRISAPMAGVVARVAVAAGDAVEAGQPLLCIEAMKMELWQHAAQAGQIKAVLVAAGQPVAAGQRLIELEPHAG